VTQQASTISAPWFSKKAKTGSQPDVDNSRARKGRMFFSKWMEK
jgi:hypothetical protein